MLDFILWKTINNIFSARTINLVRIGQFSPLFSHSDLNKFYCIKLKIYNLYVNTDITLKYVGKSLPLRKNVYATPTKKS